MAIKRIIINIKMVLRTFIQNWFKRAGPPYSWPTDNDQMGSVHYSNNLISWHF